eukprot:PITA_02677
MRNYEREASIRPPVFDGTNFVYWKVRVTAYLQSLGTKVWDIIDTAYTFPASTPTDLAEKKKYETNAKVVNTLLGCLSQSEFVKVMQYKSAKEIWDNIVLSYEGDEQEVGVQTRRTIAEASSYLALLSSTEPQNIKEACKDESWVKVMDEELEQIEKNNTWELVPRPKDKNVIGTK